MSDNVDNYFEKQSRSPTAFLKCIQILQNADDLKKLFRYNILSGRVEYTINPLWNQVRRAGDSVDDNDLINLRSYLSKQYNFSPSRQNIYDALVGEAQQNRYHPIRDWLDRLQWDGIRRLDTWLSHVVNCEDNVYTRAVSAKLLCASVARIYEPGCKFDYLTILEGAQGIRKSTLVEALAGHMRHHATISFHKTDKEIVEIMQGKWFLEVSEMQGFRRQEVERIKALLSNRVDTVRVAYGREALDYPRQSIFIGTLNPTHENQYLNDETANRRFWPIECRGHINIDLLLEMREQLFAEATLRYKANEALHLEKIDVKTISESVQEKRVVTHPWIDIIHAHLEDCIKRGKLYVTVKELALETLGIPKERLDRSKSSVIGRIMAKSGWQRQEDTSLHRRVYYIAPQVTEFDWRIINWGD